MNETEKQKTPQERVRELDKAATPGPWKHVDEYADEPHHCVIQEGQPFWCVVAECCIDDREKGPRELADGNLIAEYRTLAPQLADALDAAEAKLEAARVALEAAQWAQHRDDDGDSWLLCPVCCNDSQLGHTDECIVAKAISTLNDHGRNEA